MRDRVEVPTFGIGHHTVAKRRVDDRSDVGPMRRENLLRRESSLRRDVLQGEPLLISDAMIFEGAIEHIQVRADMLAAGDEPERGHEAGEG